MLMKLAIENMLMEAEVSLRMFVLVLWCERW